jgi:hypothetical protein
MQLLPGRLERAWPRRDRRFRRGPASGVSGGLARIAALVISERDCSRHRWPVARSIEMARSAGSRELSRQVGAWRCRSGRREATPKAGKRSRQTTTAGRTVARHRAIRNSMVDERSPRRGGQLRIGSTEMRSAAGVGASARRRNLSRQNPLRAPSATPCVQAADVGHHRPKVHGPRPSPYTREGNEPERFASRIKRRGPGRRTVLLRTCRQWLHQQEPSAGWWSGCSGAGPQVLTDELRTAPPPPARLIERRRHQHLPP